MTETKIYVDSNIYIDYFENRSDKLVPWGEFARQLFRRTFSCEFKIIISSEILKELKKYNYKVEIDNLMEELKQMNKLEFIYVNPKDRDLAKINLKSHYQDRLHYILAEKAKVKFIVTRNWKDFYDLGSIPALPAEWI